MPITMNNRRILDKEEIYRACPAVFAQSPAPSVSDRYSFLSTADILSDLEKMNWFPTEVKGATRGAKEFNIHTVRLFNPDHTFANNVHPEIAIINSHNGMRRFRIGMGVFRMVCLNGLMVGETLMNEKIKHINVDFETLRENIAALTESFGSVSEKINGYSHKMLTSEQRLAFAEAAMNIRFKDERPFEAKELLNIKRDADASLDLFTTFNVIQENVMKGGIKYVSGRRKMTTRAITSASSDITINTQLWDTMDEIASTL